MTVPRSYSVRTKVQPADVRPEIAARRMGLTLVDFQMVLPRLIDRGFPAADPDTGNYDLDAIDLWRKARHSGLYGLTRSSGAAQPARGDMGERFRAARANGQTTQRSGHDRAS